MTTWFVDPVAGTDSNASAGNGDSFATRRKKIDNLVAAAIAPGDEIRIMKSPDPTSLGVNGEWTTGPYSAAFTPTSSTNATPIVMTKAGHNLATGDTVIITGHSTNTNANGVWEVTVSGNDFTLLNADGSNSVGNGVGSTDGSVRKINSCRIKMASALTKTVALTGNRGTKTNWTASANVTATIITTDFKEGSECQQLEVASGFVTGLAAHFPLGTSTDFSGYKQLSFWIKQTSGTIGAAGDTTISLCSDTAGATPVDTFNIPALGALNRWVPVTVDKGSALGATIQSVAFNVVTDNATQTFLIDNIIACKDSTSADSLNMQSLIGKNAAGESFFAIQSINATRVMLDQSTNEKPDTIPARGYFGISEIVTTYKRETTKTAISSAPTTSIQTTQDSGSVGSNITFSGGWNTTDMTTQTGETWFDGLNGYGQGVVNTQSFVNLTKMAVVRYYRGFVLTGVGGVHDLVASNNNSEDSIEGVIGCSITLGSSCNNGQVGLYNLQNSSAQFGSISGNGTFGLVVSGVLDIDFATLSGNGNYGLYTTGAITATMRGGTISRNVQEGIDIGVGVLKLFNITSVGNAYGVILNQNTAKVYATNCAFSDTIPFQVPGASYDNGAGVYSQAAGVVTNKLCNGTIDSNTSVRHTASGISWKLSPTANLQYTNSYNPFSLSVAKVACAASALVTVKLWMRRTNTGLTARLMCKGMQIAGVTSDVSTDMTAAADTWEEVEITFTPTEVGVVEILAECWGGTTYSLYVDDFSVTQA